jgi:hypothetical protein
LRPQLKPISRFEIASVLDQQLQLVAAAVVETALAISPYYHKNQPKRMVIPAEFMYIYEFYSLNMIV